MSAELDHAVELLERSLAFTRVSLSQVARAHLRRPTPCPGWSLERLLVHMEDALDAFIEAADGAVGDGSAGSDGALRVDGRADGRPDGRAGGLADARVERLQTKACGLLGVWSAVADRALGVGGPGRVAVGDRSLAAPLLVGTAALEIAVHGWDVGCATDRPADLPAALAGDLLPVAHAVASPADRGRRFAEPLPPPPAAGPGVRLLCFLGRDPSGPGAANRPVPPPARPPGS